MGGNALKNVKTIRMDLKNYQRIKAHVIEKLSYAGYIISDIMQVPDKETYGDLDLLWWRDPTLQGDIRTDIIQLFTPQEIVTNGEVISWDLENFQIDLIKCSSLEQMEFARFYFSYGDLGSIIGRYCNYHGVKIGHRGFWIDVYECTIYPDKPLDPTRNLGEIHLSMDPIQVCDFLGLNWSEYTNGFTTIEQIFNWIIASKYFVQKIFAELNGHHMKRFKIRPMYMKFVEFIGLNPLKVNSNPKIRHNIQKEAIDYFNKHTEVDNFKIKFEFNQIVRTKFSGKNLMERGYKGKQIGIILANLDQYIVQKYNLTLSEWIYQTSINKINEVVNEMLNKLFLDK